MSGYERNAVYTRVRDAIIAFNPDVYCTAKYVPKPSRFPAAYIHEIDRNRPLQNVQFDYQDVQWESVFEVQITSTKANTSMSEAYDLMDVARSALNTLYYREFSETNADLGTQFTIIGRFRRIIGGGDQMPPELSA